MTCKTAVAAMVSFVVLAASPALADIEQYCTFISDNDKFASDGFALSEAGQILQQDRANYHRFRIRDGQDEGDRVFGTAEARSRIPGLVRAGNNDRGLLNAIVRGNPYVCVEVWSDFMVVYQN